MTYFYFVGFSATSVVGKQIAFGNIEHSTENEITSMEQIQTIIEELSTHYEGQYKNFNITGLHLLRTEEQPSS
ncbi:hypothetical protein [Priestia megaterium]|uniref:hypothetical protein n=1 Tax=Priestia megaterium TaxID=1404 RepID=UPI003242F0F3